MEKQLSSALAKHTQVPHLEFDTDGLKLFNNLELQHALLSQTVSRPEEQLSPSSEGNRAPLMRTDLVSVYPACKRGVPGKGLTHHDAHALRQARHGCSLSCSPC